MSQLDLLGDVDGVDCGIVVCIINAGAEEAEIKNRDAKKMYACVLAAHVLAAHGLSSGSTIGATQRFDSRTVTVCDAYVSTHSL